MGCISEQTARRVTLGQILQSGISEKSVACVDSKLQGVSFLKYVGAADQQGLGAESIPILRAVVGCLSAEEFARSEMFSGGEPGGPTSEQFKCLLTNASDETLVKLFSMSEGGGMTMPPQEILDLITKCGLGSTPSGGDGPPQLTPEQQKCVVAAIGEAAFHEVMTGQRPPTQEDAQKFGACGVSLGSGSSGDGPPQLTPGQQKCLVSAIGEGAFRELMNGQRPPTQNEVGKIQGCGIPMGSGTGPTPSPGGAGGQPQLTPEQVGCIIQSLGVTVLNELSSGQRGPTPEELAKIQACGIAVGGIPGR